MEWLSRAVRRLGPAFLASAVLLRLTDAGAGQFEDALTLVRSGDIDRIERSFAEDYRAFVEGELSPDDFDGLYGVFYTLDPVVLEIIGQWRTAYSDSAHARVAEAAPKLHLAYVLRGEDVIARVPRRSFERARELWGQACALLHEALDLAPQHIEAADGLESAAFYLNDDRSALRAKRVLAAHGSPVSLLLGEVHESTPQWGGSEARMRRLCDELAPKIEGITVPECHARATLMLPNLPRERREEATEILRRENPDGNRWTIAKQLLYLGRAEEALAIYDERDAWISGSLADDFARALDNYAVQERIVDRWLAINPLTPRLLAMKAEAQTARHDFEGAAESIEKAMIYGETIPEVRELRLVAMMRDSSRHEEVLGEFEDALVDTDFHPLVMERVATALVWAPDPYRYWSDGSEHADFQCRRVRMLSWAFDSCDRHPNRQATAGCLDSTLLRAQEIIGEVDLHACAAAIGTFR